MQILAIDIGVKNFSFCLIDAIKGKEFTVLEWQNVNLLSAIMGKQVNDVALAKLPSHFLIEIVMKYLSKKFPRHDVIHYYAYVVIESQWSGKPTGSSKMKEIAAAVYAYFIGIVQIPNLCCVRFPVVRMIDPKNKFNMSEIFGVCKQNIQATWPVLRKKSTYRERKQYSVDLVKFIIHHRQDFRIIINDKQLNDFFISKKQDDLCDSMLLAAAMIQMI